MVTPDGRLRLVSASITFGAGFIMSIKRLWIRISNCSRASLWTKVERLTVQRFISVGSGTGPTTFASSRAAVSIICFTETSRILCSYARTRIRSLFSEAAAASIAAALEARLVFGFLTVSVDIERDGSMHQAPGKRNRILLVFLQKSRRGVYGHTGTFCPMGLSHRICVSSPACLGAVPLRGVRFSLRPETSV